MDLRVITVKVLNNYEKPIFHTCPDEGTALEYGFFDTYLVSQVTNIGCKPVGRGVTALIFSKYQNLPVS